MADGVAERIDARRESAITVKVDGRAVSAFAGETVAAVLLAEGIRVLRYTTKRGEPRGLYCGMGICYECLVSVDGVPNVRACVTTVEPGMVIQSGRSERQHG